MNYNNKNINKYMQLLQQWQKKINLISSKTESELEQRHLKDSAQLLPYLAPHEPIVDVGTGAGFPGLVLAILGGHHAHLVESDLRKTLFLQEVIRQTQAPATIYHERVEKLSPFDTGVQTFVTRAFSSLENTLRLLKTQIIAPQRRLLCLKGVSWEREVTEAQLNWNFQVEVYPSLTHAGGRILEVSHIEKRA